MATINELPSIVTPAENSVIVVTDSASSKKITVSDLRNAMVPTASTSTAGAVKVGSGLQINGAGVLSITNYSGYTLPAATNGSLGGVIVGNGLTISAEGVLNVSSLTVPVATPYVSGTIKVGVGLHMDNGILNNTVPAYQLPSATTAVLGGVKVGYGLVMTESVVSTKAKTYAVEGNQTIDEDYTTANNKVLYSIGPITIGRTATFTVDRQATWTIYTPGASEQYTPPASQPAPIQEQDTLIVDNYSVADGKIASSIGPITIDRNVTVEIAPLSTWVIF
jgi:hypothetical protein